MPIDMPTRQDIIDEARKWVGTPFHHQGRVLGLGVDCVGVVIKIAHALGLSQFDYIAYGHSPVSRTMEKILGEHMDTVLLDARQPGDVLHMQFDTEPQHLAILTDTNTIIHAYAQVRKVVEHPLDSVWLSRVRGVFRYRGVEE